MFYLEGVGGGKGMICRFKAEGSTHEKFEFLEKRGFLGLGCFLELCVFLRKCFYTTKDICSTRKSQQLFQHVSALSTTTWTHVSIVKDYTDIMSA